MNRTRVGELCKITTGKFDVNEGSEDGDYPFFTCAAVPLKSKTYSYDGEAILLPGNGANVGMAMFYDGKFEAYQRTYVLTEFKALPKYVYYYFKSYWKGQVANKQYGSATNYIRLDNITDFKIPIPDYATQQKIAAQLELADKARQQRKAANGLTEQFLQSTFLSLFGDPVQNEKGWEVKKLETLYSNKKEGTKCGPFGSALKKHEYVAGGIPVWVMDNIAGHRFMEEGCLFVTPDKFHELQSYSVKNGDIIISRAGTVGKMCVVQSSHQNSIISTNLIKLSLNEQLLLPIFFVSLMTYFGTRVGKLRTGGDDAFTHMNTGILNNLEFPLPPLKLQQQFAAIVAQTEALRQRQRAHAEELEGMFQGLLQKYFNS